MELKTIILTFCLYYFKFFGYFPINVNLKSLKAQISVKSIIWSVLFSGTLILFGQNLDRFSFKNRKILRIITTYYHKLTSFVIFICVFLTIIKSGSILNITRKLVSIYNKITKFPVNCNSKNILKWFFIKYALIQVITTVLSIIFYLSLENKSLHGLIVFNTLSSVKYMFASAFLLKCDLLLVLLQIGFSKVNKAVKMLITSQRQDIEISDSLKQLMGIHYSLCEISEMLIRQLSFPIITILFYLFLIVEAHFLQTFLNFNENSSTFVNLRVLLSFCWASIKLVELVMVFHDVGLVIKKVSR